jgi:hypothetical protein
MFNQCWAATLANAIIAVNSNIVLCRQKHVLKECIVKLCDGSYYQAKGKMIKGVLVNLFKP